MSYGTMTLEGKRYVLVPEDEFQTINDGVPTLPFADADGSRPAVAFTVNNIAQHLVREREAAGLTQRELATRAGIRVEILNRAERGAVVPATRTLQKMEKALRAALKQKLASEGASKTRAADLSPAKKTPSLAVPAAARTAKSKDQKRRR